MSDKFRTFAMSYFCSFPSKFTFPRCSEDFLFPLTKMWGVYYVDNQFIMFKSLFQDTPCLVDSGTPDTSMIRNPLIHIKERGAVGLLLLVERLHKIELS